ncbi:MAG TPA: alpha/beta hydrolase [Anaerolineae bacterium]|jgi:pimeloyl-ACP methyl ester carboxylesterase
MQSHQSQLKNDLLKKRVFERSDCRICYWLAGPVDGPLIVLTHGAAMDHRMFAAQVSVLSQQYRVLVWDARGHGQSRSVEDTFSLQTAVEDLLALLDWLGYEQATLVGHSMGSYIGQEIAFRCPHRVKALVAIDSTCLTLKHPRLIRSVMRLSPLVFRWLPYSLFKWLAAHILSVTSQVGRYISDVYGQFTKGEFLSIWAAAMNCLHAEPDYRITQPLLISHGQNDIVGFGVIKQQARAWATRDPNVHYVVIPKAGHNAHQENPAYFNKVLLEFLHEHVPVPEPQRGAKPCPESIIEPATNSARSNSPLPSPVTLKATS